MDSGRRLDACPGRGVSPFAPDDIDVLCPFVSIPSRSASPPMPPPAPPVRSTGRVPSRAEISPIQPDVGLPRYVYIACTMICSEPNLPSRVCRPLFSASVNRLLASLKPGWRAILARPPVRTQPNVVASAIYLRTSQLLLSSTHYQLPHILEGRHMVDRVVDLNATFPLLNVTPHLETTPNPNARSTGLVTVRLPRITTYALDRAAQQQQQLVA